MLGLLLSVVESCVCVLFIYLNKHVKWKCIVSDQSKHGSTTSGRYGEGVKRGREDDRKNIYIFMYNSDRCLSEYKFVVFVSILPVQPLSTCIWDTIYLFIYLLHYLFIYLQFIHLFILTIHLFEYRYLVSVRPPYVRILESLFIRQYIS